MCIRDRYYHAQWTEVIRGADDVHQAIDEANRRAAEENGEVKFALYVPAPGEGETGEPVSLIRLLGEVPRGLIEVQETFGWTMYVDEANAPAEMLTSDGKLDPREAHLLRAQGLI